MDEDLKRESLAATMWDAAHWLPDMPSFAHEYEWEDAWPAEYESFRAVFRTAASAALSVAADRERELVEALRPFAVWADRMPDVVPEFARDISKVVQIAIANGHLTGAHFRNAARVVQAKVPT
jgi:hypothetical protein